MHKKKSVFISVTFLEFWFFVVIFLLFIGSLGMVIFAVQEETPKETRKLAIVIDDLGLQRKGVSEMLALDCKLTMAVMPFLDYSEDDAEDALENGKEVILHIPMQATVHDNPAHLGPRPISAASTENEIKIWLEDALAEIPEAVGANIHMGTLTSTKEKVIKPLMEELSRRELYFLDSKTSTKSVCRIVAEQVEIDYYENQVFLEHESKSLSYIKKRLEKAIKIARDTGSCIAIGHVGYEGGSVTAQAIRELSGLLDENNVELVFVSELMPMHDRGKLS